jgi:Tol biopolymer transport system component
MQQRFTSQRSRLVGVAIATMAVLGASQVIGARADNAAPAPVLVDTPIPADAISSQTPSVSGDGRYLVYAGPPKDAKPGAAPTTTSTTDPGVSPAAPGGDARTSTVYLKDRSDGKVVELTAPAPGVPAGNSVWPVISNDGCNVVVITQMGYDLFRDDNTGDRWDVYAMKLPICGGTLGEWQLVSMSNDSGFDASAADDVSPLEPPAVSGDGTIVAYTHRFSAAAPDITGITMVDLTVPVGQSGRSLRVAGMPTDPPDSTYRYHGLHEPSISNDGLVLAYTSDANSASAVGDWGTGPQQGGYATSNVFVWDRLNPDRNTNVRTISAGAATDVGDSGSASVSGDGSVVAFVSTETSLVSGATLPPCTPGCLPQVYLYHRADASITLGSRVGGAPAAAPVAADAGATQPSLNGTGDELLYVTRATNLFPTRNSALGAPSDGDIVLTVPGTGLVRRVSVQADGVSPAPAVNAHPHMSANGRVVVFDTLAGAVFGDKRILGRQVADVAQHPTLELANLDMGTVAVGYPGPEWFLTLNNRGPGSFVPSTVTVDNPDFLVSGGSCVDQKGIAVPPGGSCTVNVMMSPSKPGILGGTLTVAEDGFEALTISSQLAGVGGEPALAAAPAGAEAKPLVVGTRGQPLTFSVQNVAFNPVVIKSVKVTGSNPTDFTVATDGCTGVTVDAALTCTLEVEFTPTAAGRRTASVVVDTVDGAYTTMLVSGIAHYQPRLVATNTTIVAPSRQAVVGTGFAPNTAVTIAWADGRGQTFTATTDALGNMMASFLVRATDRPGNRTLVAQTKDGEVATTDVLVVSPNSAAGPNSPLWPGAHG